MNAETGKRLAALLNRATRYEVAAQINGRAFLLGYRRRLSKSSVLGAWYEATTPNQRQRVVDALGVTDDTPMNYAMGAGWIIGDSLRIFCTRRTEREAIIEGEKPRVTNEGLDEALNS